MKQFDGIRRQSNPVLLVTSIFGHDDLLDYLSSYRTQDKFKGKHYYPSGALCWFEANQYGDLIGTAYYARKIPDMSIIDSPNREKGYNRFRKQLEKKLRMTELFARELPDTEIWSYPKRKYPQFKKGNRNATKKNNRRNGRGK